MVLMASGVAVGWRVHTGILEFLAGVGLLLLFTFAMSWIGVWLGTMVPTVEVANQVGFTILFPLTFLSNVFVPPQTLPSWLRVVAEWNPTSALTAATRPLDEPLTPLATLNASGLVGRRLRRSDRVASPRAVHSWSWAREWEPGWEGSHSYIPLLPPSCPLRAGRRPIHAMVSPRPPRRPACASPVPRLSLVTQVARIAR
jgi:hypothetical protein